MLIGVDVGGTFVDLALFQGDALLGTHKLLNRPGASEEAVLEGASHLLSQHGISFRELDEVVYSTTLAVNAIIERRGGRTALVCTEGFRDALEVRNEQPYDLYNPFAAFPEPLVPRSRRIGIVERVLADGAVATEPSPESLKELCVALGRTQASSVAICLLNSYANPKNEKRVADVIRERLPNVAISLSHEVLPEIGEYGRSSTAATNAYLSDVVGRHLERLDRILTERGFVGRLWAVTSAGGLVDRKVASQFPVKLLESGPAAGSVGIAIQSQVDRVTFDMGGTTAKTTLIRDSSPHRTSDYEVGRIERFRRGSGLLVRVPTIDIIEIGAGGGSIARLDKSGILVVGPESAGANPGPACYGRGGLLPTVTDADLVLGFLNPANFLAGNMRIDRGLAEGAIRQNVAHPLGIDVTEAALSIYRLVNAHMSQALSVHAAERGINLKRFEMVAFGGAGPVHAWAVAEEAGVERLVVPSEAGVLSAVGCKSVPGAFEVVATHRGALDRLDCGHVDRLLAGLRQEAIGNAAALAGGGERFEYEVDVQYIGQRTPLVVPFTLDGPFEPETVEQIGRGFEVAYRDRYGRTVPLVRAETLTWRVRAAMVRPGSGQSRSRGADSNTRPMASGAQRFRDVVFPDEGRVQAQIRRREDLPVGTVVNGPAVIEDSSTTIIIPPMASARVEEGLAIAIDLSERLAARSHKTPTVSQTGGHTLGIYWGKLVSIAEEAATTLARTAFSRIVTEARDYSCVVCDSEGDLVAQPLQGLPEFVNSLAEAVRHFLRFHPPGTLQEGDVLISNDPLLCTSQMNDFVLVQPIFRNGRIVSYAANVSHSPDVGGRLLSAEAREIFEEGMRFPVCKLFEGGRPNELLLAIMRANTRLPEIMIGDLMAQAAANRVTADLLLDFLEREGLDGIDAFSTEIKQRSEAAVREAIRHLPQGSHRGEVTMDGLTEPLTIRCEVIVTHDPAAIKVDFAGTSPQTNGSLNCYLNYISAEAAYALLTVLQPGTHINAGSLRPFSFSAPQGCLVNASPPAAVGARTLVVQYVVSAIYNALADVIPDRILAEPAAPVWPVLLSGQNEHGQRFVESILLNGGLGARPSADGVLLGFPAPVVSTKVEVLESELPFVIERSQLIENSGGDGCFRGGPGQSFVLRSRSSRPVQVLLRTERLRHPARGVRGGMSGRAGAVALNGNTLQGKETFAIDFGDVLSLETPGGGGYGPPEEREPGLRQRDLDDGLVVATSGAGSAPDSQQAGGKS